jgi:DNA polymerase
VCEQTLRALVSGGRKGDAHLLGKLYFCYSYYMTEEQQAGIARFLDTAYGFLKTGYFEEPAAYNFEAFGVPGTRQAEALPGPGLGDKTAQAVLPDTLPAALPEKEGAMQRTGPGLGGGERPAQAGLETGGRGDDAAVCRRQSGNSAPLQTDKAEADAGQIEDSIDRVADTVRVCTLCGLHATRVNAVPGEGVERPLALVVGEGPGADEDTSGRPFVGAAGRLLDQMLLSIGLDRKRNCFIANVVKCRPPGNRDPLPTETAACLPFFERQLVLLRPLVILTVGKVPVKTLLGTDEGITRLRGNWKSYRGIPLLPTFHPSYLLRDVSQKKFAWEDLKALCRRLVELDAAYAAETAGLRGTHGI